VPPPGELAQRLAHELKNPLFPLQITVENMQRARTNIRSSSTKSSAGAATLLAELANLKQSSIALAIFQDAASRAAVYKSERNPARCDEAV
jgi:nitrogen fixation/metabolism regulation signal transduction histidine kinase